MGSLQLSDPFSVEGFDDFFKSMMRPVRFEMVTPAPDIKLEVREDDDAFRVKAEIPGVNKEDLNVKVDGDTVTISAETKQQKEDKNGKVLKSEFRYGASSRTFSLGTELDMDRTEATYQDGVLHLTLPKKPSARSTTVKVS